jgi:hypothetical protein
VVEQDARLQLLVVLETPIKVITVVLASELLALMAVAAVAVQAKLVSKVKTLSVVMVEQDAHQVLLDHLLLMLVAVAVVREAAQ